MFPPPGDCGSWLRLPAGTIHMPRYLPICLNMENRTALIIGAGKIGTEKCRELLDCGARITVISPVVSSEIAAAAESHAIRLEQRRYSPGDTDGYFLTLVATDDPACNAAAYTEADARGALVNVCDDPRHCNYIFAARVERGPLTVSVFTHGTSPALARRVRREMEAWLGPEYGLLAERLATIRPLVAAIPELDQRSRQRVYERIVYSEALLLYRENKAAEAEAMIERILREVNP